MCNSLDYTKKQIQLNDRIYIDTCSILNTDRFEKFLETSRNVFLTHNKMLHITNAVMSEIEKHAYSDNLAKKENAEKALSIIAKNEDIFFIENDRRDDCEPFADPEIFETLLKGRNHSQLLISNDRNLTSDVYKLNFMDSFHSNRINVCYLNFYGQLKMCDCVRQNIADTNSESETVVKEKIIRKTVMVKKEVSAAKKYGLPLITFCSGAVLGAFYKPIMETVKNIDWRKMVWC